MRTPIFWSVVLLSFALNLYSSQDIQTVTSVTPNAEEVTDALSQRSQEFSKVTDTCIEHLVSLIVDRKKNLCLAQANQHSLHGEYAAQTANSCCEYTIRELADQKTVFLLATIKAHNKWFSSTDDLGDKLHEELDKSFKQEKGWLDLWQPHEVKPDSYAKCRYYAKGNSQTADIHHYTIEINGITKEFLTSLLNATQQKKAAKKSLSSGRSFTDDLNGLPI